MAEWKIKRGDEEFTARDGAMLLDWARAARIRPDDYVLNPILDRWMYASEVAELQPAFGAQNTAVERANLNRASWSLGCLGILLCFIFWPAGVVLLIIAIVMSAFYYIKR